MYQPPYSAPRSEVDDDVAASNGEPNAPVRGRALGPGRQAWLNGVAASPMVTSRVRRALLRVAGIDIEAAGVLPHVVFVSGHDVKIGDQAFVSTGVVFDAGARIELGPRVSVGPRAQFLTSTHDLGPSTWRAGHNRYAPIRVEEGTWIGAGAIVLAGVTVGAGCVIAAGAVVTHDCERDGLYAGVPAVRKRDLPPLGPVEQGWRPRAAAPGPGDAARGRHAQS
jgi:maltose O-acetyltransferase